jgi:lipopolysaccharide/colanic/teichoic acid biosynthesis glycosyltransferase
MKKRYFFFLLEPVLILFVFGVLGYLFNVDIFAKKLSAPVTYMTLWLTGSFLLRKDKIKVNVEKTLNMLAKKSIAIHVVIVVLFYYLQVLDHKWFYLTAFVALTLLEMIGITLFSFNKLLEEDTTDPDAPRVHPSVNESAEEAKETLTGSLQMLIVGEIGKSAFDFINQHIDRLYTQTLFLSTTTRFNVAQQPDNAFVQVVNLKAINKAGRINKLFETINHKLPAGGKFIGFAETNDYYKIKIFKKYPKGLNYLAYLIYYLWHRAFPKIYGLREFYFVATAGKHRELSKAETFGRLYSCGFEVIGEEIIDGRLFFVAQKIKVPVYDNNPTYGPLIRLKRTGKNGKVIGVYKFRSMYPFAEYLQDYVYKKNALDKGGKFKDDFRVTTEGKILRKFWLDELPMFINLFKGEMKLVGVRPLSKHYFSLYTKELQEKRSKHKPGLLPPFYVDMPETLEEIMASEMRYLEQYERKPLLTDWKYFWAAVYNILIKKVRSK